MAAIHWRCVGVVGQLHIFDLGQVLADLREARGQSAESLYTFIFRRAWDHLDQAARSLFIAMLLTSDEGDTLDDLLAICEAELSGRELRTGLKQLVMFNLVESRGGLLERRYTIHNLTRFVFGTVKLNSGRRRRDRDRLSATVSDPCRRFDPDPRDRKRDIRPIADQTSAGPACPYLCLYEIPQEPAVVIEVLLCIRHQL
ncbi:MAG: hypothetical protein R2932_57135 [Caldilineaceae bacterium]